MSDLIKIHSVGDEFYVRLPMLFKWAFLNFKTYFFGTFFKVSEQKWDVANNMKCISTMPDFTEICLLGLEFLHGSHGH
jgi:hypothetical protein